MDRNFGKDRAAGAAAGSTPSDAWLFAQALLGKPVPIASRAETDARVNREQLAWLAQISPEHERQLRGRLTEEANARAQREQLEWLASISPRHERELRSLLQAESEGREAHERLKWLVEGSRVQEAEWDPAKHPRLGSPPNPGWFAPAGVFAFAGGTPPKQRAPIGGSAAPAQAPATKQQLPADDRGTWIKGTKGDGVFRYNNSIKNQQAGVAGKEVRFENQRIAIGGFPPEAYYGGSAAEAGVEIKTFTGTRADNAAADAAMREKLGDPTWQRPEGYEWNHAGPPGSKTMELVDADFHEAVAHKGWAAELRAARRLASARGVTGRALGVVTVILTIRDALQAAGALQPSYVVDERETYHFVADDGSVFVVWPAGWFSSAKREFVAGPRQGQTEKITDEQVEQYRTKAEEVWGKYIPETRFSGARFIPGTKRTSVPLIIYKYGVPFDAGWIDENGVHRYPSPRPAAI